MKRTIKNILLSLTLILSGAFTLAAPQIASADSGVNVFSNCGSGVSSTTSGAAICNANNAGDFTKLMKNIINTLLLVLGMIAVIMIIIGGIRYTTSNGDSSQITSAKNTVLYAVVGLVIAIMAYAIVNFVLNAFK